MNCVERTCEGAQGTTKKVGRQACNGYYSNNITAFETKQPAERVSLTCVLNKQA